MDAMPTQLGFRGVRTSKFRHVFGHPARKEHCYDNIKITKNAHDCNFCAVNPKFLAVVTEVAGGGSFLVLPLEKVGRLDHHNAFKVAGHSGPVLDIKWNPFDDNVIASSSDDATVKIWHIPDGGLQSNLTEWLVELSGHKRRVGFIEWHPTAENILASVGFDYTIVIWHVTKSEIVNVLECHPDIIYSISWNRDGSLLATTCKDKKLRIIDPRRNKVLQEGPCHTGTKASKVVYLGDTGKLCTTGFARHSDRQYGIWDEKDLSKPLIMEIIDSSSGVIFPFYDHDTKLLYLAGKGDGNIRYYEIVDQYPWIHYLSQYLSGSPQRGVGWMPKRGCDVFKCEVARFYKLHAIKGLCEPISMIVPRKSDQFQDDIFPDTAAPSPATTGMEWMNGVSRPPVIMSLKTGVVVKTHKPMHLRLSEISNGPSDRNNEMKHAFLSHETNPDYRTMEDNEGLRDVVDNGEIDVDRYSSDYGDDDKENGYDSDLGLGPLENITPPPPQFRNQASQKIVKLFTRLQQDAHKYDLAKEKDTQEKWEKTRMNKAVQQKKVATIVSQLQNPTPSPALSTEIIHSNFTKQDIKKEKRTTENVSELSTLDDFRIAYRKKCLEVERLQVMAALKDKRIQELEDHIKILNQGPKNVHTTSRPQTVKI